jgi:hypothetical protein
MVRRHGSPVHRASSQGFVVGKFPVPFPKLFLEAVAGLSLSVDLRRQAPCTNDKTAFGSHSVGEHSSELHDCLAFQAIALFDEAVIKLDHKGIK